LRGLSLDLKNGCFEEEEEENFWEERHPEHCPPAQPLKAVDLQIPIQENESVRGR